MAYHDTYMHGSDGPNTFAWLLMFLLLALLIGLVALFVTKWESGRRAVAAGAAPLPRTADDPYELVRLRYARGEIDRETFLQVSQDLSPPSG